MNSVMHRHGSEGLPLPDELLQLHASVLAGDPAAPPRLAVAVLDALVRRVRGQIRRTYSRDRIGDDQIESACGLTIARYLKAPHLYDPAKGGLLGWLAMDVVGDVQNEAMSAATRREAADSAAVELRSVSRKSFLDEAESASVEEVALDGVDRFDLDPDVAAAVRDAVSEYSPEDLAVIELIGQGVRETAAYSEVLGISHLAAEAQRREVKRHKDRLTRRLERLRERLA
jgi:RNA polymerase sigma-70 factor, ECF subfamily